MTELTRYSRRIDHVVTSSENTIIPQRLRPDSRRVHLPLVQRSLRSAVREEPRPGLFVFVAASAFGHVGRLWLAATDAPRAGVIGRHDQVDLQLGLDDTLSLRQVMFVVRLREGRVCFTVLDLDTPNGLASSADTPVHLLESDELLSFRAGGLSFFCAPTGPGRDVPEAVDDAWARFDAMPRRREATWHHRLLRRRERAAAGLVTVHTENGARGWSVGEAALARGVLVGRAPRCGVFIGDDDRVSRVHAVLLTIDGVTHLIDAGSTNGTWHDGEEIRCQPLRDGDVYELGDSSLRWSTSQ
jgi:hypothetical protein